MLQPEHIGTTALVFILVGILSSFVGYRLFKIILGIWGFIGGAIITSYLLQFYFQVMGNSLLIGALVGGIVGVVLFLGLYKVGIFGLGALLGFSLATMVIAARGGEADPLVFGLSALLGGIMALLLQRPMIIISTAFSGAWLLVIGLASFLKIPFNLLEMLKNPRVVVQQEIYSFVWVVLWLIVGIAGSVIQFKYGGHKPK
jgi:hypothetical protein